MQSIPLSIAGKAGSVTRKFLKSSYLGVMLLQMANLPNFNTLEVRETINWGVFAPFYWLVNNVD